MLYFFYVAKSWILYKWRITGFFCNIFFRIVALKYIGDSILVKVIGFFILFFTQILIKFYNYIDFFNKIIN